jgi:hypothetical protein
VRDILFLRHLAKLTKNGWIGIGSPGDDRTFAECQKAVFVGHQTGNVGRHAHVNRQRDLGRNGKSSCLGASRSDFLLNSGYSVNADVRAQPTPSDRYRIASAIANSPALLSNARPVAPLPRSFWNSGPRWNQRGRRLF